ncbi:hypothetical protein AB6A40_002884 [Gnathostoma spinigerum]|uniref:Clustered mitochondria protein homolog n=1 Tax=Gnathostoma spinigerum TaxID=75299 RepID=A0ABD6E7W1_9BILA
MLSYFCTEYFQCRVMIMGEDIEDSVCGSKELLASTAEGISTSEGTSDKTALQSAEDSGHASNASSPDSQLTPNEERISSPTSDQTAENILYGNETMYRIHIVSPGSEPFDLQVNPSEMVQELHQVLLERESTCHRTCFSLQLDGVTLDHFTELKNISGLKDGSVLKVVEEPYTTREARIHLRHVRELIRSLDTSDAYTGMDGASLTYLPSMTLGDRKKSLDKSMDCSPPEYVLPGYRERLLTPLLPPAKEEIVAVQSLAISSFNPPPGPRKMKGDVLYLTAETKEGRRYHITCCTRGFYVNATTDSVFRPTISPAHKTIYHSLIDLLSSISPAFKKAIAVILKKRAEKHVYERLPTPYQVNTWTAPNIEQTEDAIRAEDCTQPHRIGLEDHIPGQIRDWNEELQTTHDLPRSTLPERLIRERAIFKIHSDFVSAAVKGAMAVVDGNVMAINPADEPRTHMYIWNNIFFSLGFDVKDHYKELGGDAAAHAATSNDLQGVRAYAQMDNAKLFTLGMVVVDYKGYRVTAQSIIPGILEREQEQSVVYGSVDFGKTVVSDEKYHELLKGPAEHLKILPHEVLSGKEDGKIVKLYSSFETKGIIGNDSRHYILDLLRTFPPDVNYLEGAEVTEVCKANGYPRKFPHKLASLRRELVDAFVEYRYLMFVRIAAHHVQQMRLGTKEEKSSQEKLNDEVNGSAANEEHKSDDDEDDDEAIVSKIKDEIVADAKKADDSIVLPDEESAKRIVSETKAAAMKEDEKMDNPDKFSSEFTKQVMAKAATAVGSYRSDEFDIRFNPDCYCPTVKHAPTEDLAKQRKLIAEAAEFLLLQQIPNFVRDCLQHSLTPLDGTSLSEALHSRGINIRYLGKLTKCIQNVKQLSYFKAICISEVICRSVKHIFRVYMQPVSAAHTAIAISHFLNCLLGSASALPLPLVDEGVQISSGIRKSKSTKKKRHLNGNGKESDEWALTSAKMLWSRVCSEADSYYGYALEGENMDVFLAENGIQKTSVLRRFCQLNGVQILCKDYGLETAKKIHPFSEDDIQNMFTLAKHVDPKAADAHSLFINGQAKMQQGDLRAGFELVAEALNLMTNVYGAMHPDMAQCMRLLARFSYILGDPAEALSQQHKATLMGERCNGLDSANTIVEYLNLAHISFANLHIVASLKLLYRARYLLLLVHGENHPLMAQIDGNIGVILYAIQEYDDALKFLESALKLHQSYSDPRAFKTALIYHLIARTQSCRGDFRAALQMEKETFTIYSKTFGEEHEKTKESGECLKHLTQQAVIFQKRINEANRQGTSNFGKLIPIEIHRPSLQSVLEILNILNGIIFIQLKNTAFSVERDAIEDASNHEKPESAPLTESVASRMEEEALD